MNKIVLLCNKLKVIIRYCDDGQQGLGFLGMADVSRSLTGIMEGIVRYSAVNPSDNIDIAALLGSLQLSVDAVEARDAVRLSSALREGLLPEFERVMRSRISFEEEDISEDSKKAEERLETSCQPLVICLFGYGDGAYYEELCKKAPEGSTFIVYEPETDCISDLQKELVKTIDFYALERVVVLSSPGYDTIFCSEYIQFANAINNNRVRVLVNLNALRRFKEDASKNVITNLHILQKCNLVSSLSSILPREIPVIIVSAGPSLDKNIDLLKKAKGHSLIFAVDTALKYLMERDIMPDLAITVEPIKPMANYEDDRCFDIPHIFDCESNPEIVSREKARIFIFNCRDYVKRLLLSIGVDVPSDSASGGSVATAAFAICYQLRMQNVILIGQDLAYEGTSTHAGGVESAGLNGDIGTDMVDGVNGEPVRTRSDWQGYLHWFEDSIKTINEQKMNMTVIDATEGGALIHGSHVMTLADAIERYCTKYEYIFSEELKKLPYLLDDEEYAEVLANIKGSFEELKTVKEAALNAVLLCEKVISADGAAGSNADGSGQSAAVTDAARRELAGYRRACESALLYPLINNYAVSDIADEVNRLRQEENGALSEIRQQKLAFDAIAKACDYFEKMRPE